MNSHGSSRRRSRHRGLTGTARVLSIAFAMSAASAAAAQSIGSEEIGNRELGGRLAAEVCSECHAVEAGDPISPNFNAPAFQDIADRPATTALALGVWFRSPHPTMPNFVLSPDETADIIAYILGLRETGK